MEGTRLRLPRSLLEVHQGPAVPGQVLTYHDDSRLSLRVAPAIVEAEIAARRTWGREHLRRFTLGTPWGRLVPPACMPLLQQEASAIEARSKDTLAEVQKLISADAEDYQAAVQADFVHIWQRVHPNTEPTTAAMEEVAHLALSARERFRALAPLPVDARLRLAWIDQAALHHWKAHHGGPAEDDQRSLDDGRTLGEMKALLQAQVTDIRGWYALPFEAVLLRYGKLLAGN